MCHVFYEAMPSVFEEYVPVCSIYGECVPCMENVFIYTKVRESTRAKERAVVEVP